MPCSAPHGSARIAGSVSRARPMPRRPVVIRVPRLVGLSALVLMLAVAALPGVASADSPARPDLAIVTLGASVRRDNSDAAFTQANALMTQVSQMLRTQGIAERDVSTRQFNLSPEFGRANGDAPAPIVAWRAVNIVAIKI